MKLLSAFFLIFMLSGSKLQEKEHVPFPSLYGKWIMCKNICDGLTVSRNVCTYVTFLENGKGILKKPGEESNFDWMMHNKTIEFKFDTELDKQAFISSDTTFVVKAISGESIEIILVSKDLRCEYFLFKIK